MQDPVATDVLRDAPDKGARQTARPIDFCQDGVPEHDHRRAAVEKPVSPEAWMYRVNWCDSVWQ